MSRKCKPYLRLFLDGYVPPSSADVRREFRASGYSGQEIADMLGVNIRTVRRWSERDTATGYRQIPYPVWRLFLLLTGRVNCLWQSPTK